MIVPKQPDHTDVAVLLRRRNHCKDRRESEDRKPGRQSLACIKAREIEMGKKCICQICSCGYVFCCVLWFDLTYGFNNKSVTRRQI